MDAAAFRELTREEQIARIEVLGRAALREFGVVPTAMTPLVHVENTTFRIESMLGDFCLRVCRPGYQSDANLASEVVFMSALTEAGLNVPRPYEGRAVKAAAPEVPEPRNCVLLGWQEGEFAKEGFTPDQARALGREMAKLHAFSAAWSPPAGFDRQAIHDSIRSDARLDGPIDRVDEADRELLSEIKRRSLAMLERLPRDSEHFGLIHGDLHRSNVLFEDGEVRIIDFDDTGWAHWIADFAAALLYEVEGLDYSAIESAMLEGYAEIRPLPPETRKLLPDFMRLRYLTLCLWVLSRDDNPRLHEAGPGWVHSLCETVRQRYPLS